VTADPDLLRRSPLGPFATVLAEHSSPAVRLRELPYATQINVQYDPAGPAGERVRAATDGFRVLTLGPQEWLVVGPDGGAAELSDRLRTALAADDSIPNGSTPDSPTLPASTPASSIVDVSGNRTTLELAGPAAREVLAKGCSIDLHPRAFQPGDCAQTTVSKVNVLLYQVDELPTYHLLVRGSFAQYLADWLLDAMAEFRSEG
jgi:sarcosine oxidase subunit gamma